MDTRIFKEIYNSRINRKMPSFEVPEAVKEVNVKIYKANDPFLFENQLKAENLKAQEAPEDAHKTQHPLHKEEKAYIFEGEHAFSDGIAQTVLHNLAKVDVSEEAVRDSILHGEKYDPSLEKLPRRFDPVLFWMKHIRVHGTPVLKRNNIILDNLLRHIIFAAIRSGALGGDALFHYDRDEAISTILKDEKRPFVLRGMPHITVQTANSAVNLPWASEAEVQAASAEPLPDIYPIAPEIDLRLQNVYNDETLIPRRKSDLNLHSLLWSREQDQKYPWTREQNAANAIMHTYGAAVAQATRNETPKLPVMMRGVQLVDGRLDLVAFQLNSLDRNDDSVKNIVWLEKGIRLYKPKPYYEQLQSVEEVDMNSFKKLAALVLTFGKES
ncbi:unnamed protein product [Caenorhabditis auriculariae]|uniref:Uncharacterized protein n=1 Tax=Caenorhabditis auriculariae TaxID=2777116 RepID=A0A8S1HNY3_9PELO|nr:unnamed protein product [Caenorhabditis auriculariae]